MNNAIDYGKAVQIAEQALKAAQDVYSTAYDIHYGLAPEPDDWTELSLEYAETILADAEVDFNIARLDHYEALTTENR